MQHLQTEVLVVGGGTGGTAAAIQAARRGAQTILVSEFD
ncbi:MAG: FAD-dependent oxidoreductase, partial [Microcoleus sp. SIO2G3]|nr:FAD-dependent oxidoreductase [Microcoleus sp. SIO2G3]